MGAVLVQGQQPTGEIRLQVQDPSGAVVEAAVRLRSPAAGLERTFQTDTQGSLSLPGLPFGRYSVEISKNGFATSSVEINVQTPSPVSQTVTLALEQAAYAIYLNKVKRMLRA